MSEHTYTPEPWYSDGEKIWRRPPSELYENGGGVAGDKPIAVTYRGWYGEEETSYPYEANARRIVACVNACAGIPTEQLEFTGAEFIAQLKRGYEAEEQRDELLKALERAREDINWMLNSQQFLNAFVFDYMDAAIAKAKGKQP